MENNNKNEVKKFCEEHHITENQFYGKEKIEGYLDLSYVKELPNGFNPTISGNLWLNSVEELPNGFNPTIGGGLYLGSVEELPAGFNPTVGGSLWLNSVEELPDGFNYTVGGSLYLNSVETLPAGFNPTVGGWLDLKSVKSLPAGFNPTVGGYLNLSSVEELPDGFNYTVGGGIFTKDTTKRINNLPNNGMLSWQNGRYIKVDGIFTEVIKHRCNVYHTRCIGKDEILYLVTDVNGTWAHGSTLSEAKEDLIYKNTSRNKDSYTDLTLDSELTFQEAVTCYRVITGACAAGVREFVERKLTNTKKAKDTSFTIKGIIDMTVEEYGHDAFVGFFHK